MSEFVWRDALLSIHRPIFVYVFCCFDPIGLVNCRVRLGVPNCNNQLLFFRAVIFVVVLQLHKGHIHIRQTIARYNQLAILHAFGIKCVAMAPIIIAVITSLMTALGREIYCHSPPSDETRCKSDKKKDGNEFSNSVPFASQTDHNA